MVPNIGLVGRARSGKDTAGRWLVEHAGYERVAFADPLKEVALRLDPWVVYSVPGFFDNETIRLADLVEHIGWNRAKSEYPEVRRILQELGAAMRALDEDFWLRLALERTTDVNAAGSPVVITDVRYPNEVESLARAGFHLTYIERPGIPHMPHESEQLTATDADDVIVNCGTLDEFKDAVRDIYHHISPRKAAA